VQARNSLLAYTDLVCVVIHLLWHRRDALAMAGETAASMVTGRKLAD